MDEQNVESSGAGTTIIIVLGVLGFLGLICLIGGGMLLIPAISKVRSAAGNAKARNNYMQLGIAMHNYHSDHGDAFPAHALYSKDGKTPNLSWRVAVLPYIEQNALYQQFAIDSPWDDARNGSYIGSMPMVYASLESPGTPPNSTHMQGFVGGGAFFSATPKGMTIKDLTDGTSNTIMIVEAGNPVPWSKPADIDYDASKPLPPLGLSIRDFFLAVMADGSVRLVPKKTPEAGIRAAISVAGNDVVPDDF